ncbi:MAG: hypothetical protein KBT36_12070 [Kurthia sp.]|nr:hypothetical protein [Candidatus Kurthia equi]
MKKLMFLALAVCLVGCSENKNQTEAEFLSELKQKEVEMKKTWDVVVSKDEMRGTELKWLAVRSANYAGLEFPYDGKNQLQLDVLDSKTNSPRIFLTIDKGQYDCESYGCSAYVKFGNAPVQSITFVPHNTSGGDGTILTLKGGSEAFMSNIRNFKKITIELPFYRQGTRQFIFDTTGFNEAEAKI